MRYPSVHFGRRNAPFRCGDWDGWFTLQDPLAAGSGAAARYGGRRGAGTGESIGALARWSVDPPPAP